jgi:hypothetical protein
MKSFRTLIARFAALIALALCASNATFAQTAAGTLSGRVSDAATGKSLQGAVVRVLGTNAVDYTDANGRFNVVRRARRRAARRDRLCRPRSECAHCDDRRRRQRLARCRARKQDAHAAGVYRRRVGARSVARDQPAENRRRHREHRFRGNLRQHDLRQSRVCAPAAARIECGRRPGRLAQRHQHPRRLRRIQLAPDRRQPRLQSRRHRPLRRHQTTRGRRHHEHRSDQGRRHPTATAMRWAVSSISFHAPRFSATAANSNSAPAAPTTTSPTSGATTAALTYSDIFSIGGQEKNLGLSFTVTKYTTDRYSENADVDWVSVTAANNPTLRLANDTKFLEASHSERSFRARIRWASTRRSISASTPTTHFISARISAATTNLRRPTKPIGTSTRAFRMKPPAARPTRSSRPTARVAVAPPARAAAAARSATSAPTTIRTTTSGHGFVRRQTREGRDEAPRSRTIFITPRARSSARTSPSSTSAWIPIAQGYYVMEYDASNRLRPDDPHPRTASAPPTFAYARQGPTNLIIVPRTTKKRKSIAPRLDWEKKLTGERVTNTRQSRCKSIRSSKPEV